MMLERNTLKSRGISNDVGSPQSAQGVKYQHVILVRR